MLKCSQLETDIENIVTDYPDYIIFEDLLDVLSKKYSTNNKVLKRILYKNASKYYYTSGFINGKRISSQNFVITSKRVFTKAFKQIESSLDYELSFEEKNKIINYLEFLMRRNDYESISNFGC